ncbi:sensor histidine kinase [Usitatibacter palustris]|uniref:histidine kinase n=1 Tax=Usitatibacter palustris TaxID=2732487 RepID=A0A6M4H558_9PROT|nr:HAMP domain-containing sensor histidine kinase [Usitatibacter palustris]QJR14610.1 Adaptive-response sensory-kinase SasA [Usitatibacter palustris]
MKILRQLATAILEERDAVLLRWRARVRALPSAAKLDVPTLNDHLPGWIAELAACLVTASEAAEGDTSPSSPLAHGLQRFEDGFDIEEVVSEYNILRDCIHDLGERHGVTLAGDDRRYLDKFFDDAIGDAVKAFAASQAREVERRRSEHLAFVAHDLRTPLSVIAFSTYLLEKRVGSNGLDAENTRLLKILARNTRQLEALVGAVLAENTQLLTELGVKIERRKFDLWPMVETVIQDIQPIATKAATRVINQVPDEIDANADANLLRRVLQNLLSNAITYAPGGEVIIGARDPGGVSPLEIWVQDDGAGIPADRLDKVFEALETDPKRDGLGLGLAIVKTFVEAHGGKVVVESVVGQGATFRFTLPRAPAVSEEAPAPAVATTPVAEA